MQQHSAPERGAEGRRSSELAARVGSALVLAVVALGTTYAGGILFAVLWFAAGAVVALEWITITGLEPRRAVSAAAVTVLAAVGAASFLSGRTALAAAILAVGLLAVVLVARSGRDRVWAAAGLCYAAVIVVVPPLVRADPRLGLVGILWMFAVVWATDIAAYFTGRALGGPKLFAPISPKKTWSGFLGGLAAGTAGGALVASEAGQFGWTAPASLPAVAAASAIASVLSQAGDLGESALKRAFAVKDSGHIIPGHGGVMDRLDGFWAVALLAGAFLALRSV